MSERVYLDWNATAPLRGEARAAMIAALDVVGNPSSVHAEGRAARSLIEEARERVAALVGAEPRNVTFTSGGTEANILALGTPYNAASRADSDRLRPLLVSAIEHPSVLAGGRLAASVVERIPVTPDGTVDISALRGRLAALAGRASLVSVMTANNETGVVQPIPQVARLVHEAGGLLHVDAVQTAGRIPCDINMLEADLLTLSGHKLGGPKGAGALIKRDYALKLDPLLKGGGQERGLRAGTENVPGVVGFGAAAGAVMNLAAANARTRTLRDRLEAGLRATSPGVVIFGANAERLPNTTLFAVAGMKAETAIIGFDLDGVAVSSGAACSSGKVAPSHVLAAMGVPPPLARGAVRVSLGPTTTEAEIDRFLDAWIKLFQSLTKRRDIAA